MIQLFKAKSLKSNTKTEQGADGMSVQSAGVSAGAQEAGNKNAKKQRGRSMVEMLGVLAIIGVLSIGGIQGYTLAMRKYRANEVLNIVQKYAMVIYSGCQNAMEKDPEHYGIISEDKPYGDNSDYWYAINSWYCPAVKFTDAGLGALPSGILKIGGDVSMVDVTQPSDGGISIKSFSSGDAVVITVKFETKELCETVMGIIGEPYNVDGNTLGMKHNETNDYTCGKKSFGDYAGYYLAVTTMMN